MYLNLVGSFKSPSNGIHIINSHFINKEVYCKKDDLIFREFLRYIDRKATIISIQDAMKMLKNDKLRYNKVFVAFTFDDGFKECIKIASILDEFNCKAAFFINSNYIESNENYQLEFNKRVDINTKKPMNWDDVKKLHLNGHLIGSHGLDHLDFGKIDKKTIETQLKKNKEILEDKLNYNCEYFSWTYGQFNNFPVNILELTLSYHSVIFSGTDFKNYYSYDGKVINRRHIEPNWNRSYINYFLSFRKK